MALSIHIGAAHRSIPSFQGILRQFSFIERSCEAHRLPFSYRLERIVVQSIVDLSHLIAPRMQVAAMPRMTRLRNLWKLSCICVGLLGVEVQSGRESRSRAELKEECAARDETERARATLRFPTVSGEGARLLLDGGILFDSTIVGKKGPGGVGRKEHYLIILQVQPTPRAVAHTRGATGKARCSTGKSG